MNDQDGLVEIAQIILSAARIQGCWQLDFRSVVRLVDSAGPEVRRRVVTRESLRALRDPPPNTPVGGFGNVYQFAGTTAHAVAPNDEFEYLQLFPLWDALCEQAGVALEPTPIAFALPAPCLSVLSQWEYSTKGWPFLYRKARFFFARRSRSQRMR